MSDTDTTAGQYQRQIVEHIEDAAFVVDGEWRLAFVNRASPEAVDATLDELRGQPIMDLAETLVRTETDQERFEQALSSVLEDGDQVTERIELDLPTGRSVGEYRFTPIRDGNETTGVTVVARDVTEQWERETELGETQDILEKFYQTSTQTGPFEDRLEEILAFGREYIGVEQGFLTEIDGETQRIAVGAGPNEQLQTGKTGPYSESYCRHTVDDESANLDDESDDIEGDV
jgi:PAS domain S-box-containing protein